MVNFLHLALLPLCLVSFLLVIMSLFQSLGRTRVYNFVAEGLALLTAIAFAFWVGAGNGSRWSPLLSIFFLLMASYMFANTIWPITAKIAIKDKTVGFLGESAYLLSCISFLLLLLTVFVQDLGQTKIFNSVVGVFALASAILFAFCVFRGAKRSYRFGMVTWFATALLLFGYAIWKAPI